MKQILMTMAVYSGASLLVAAVASPGPSAIAPAAPVAAPRDRAYPGEIRLAVNATDIEQRIVHVHETLTGIGADTVLLYPKWLPGTHAPEGPLDRLAGIKITASGAPVSWTRDPVDVYAFHVHPAAGVKSLDIDFDYLSPTSPKVGAIEMTRDILLLEWNSLVLYPAGYFARQIPVQASVALPADWKFGSALEIAGASSSAPPSIRSSTAPCMRAAMRRGLTLIRTAQYRSIWICSPIVRSFLRSHPSNWRRTEAWCSRPTSSTARIITRTMISSTP